MTVNSRLRTPLLLAGLGLLAMVALVGWLRNPSPPAQAYFQNDPNLAMQQPLATTAAAYRQNGYYSSPVYERRYADTQRVERTQQRLTSTTAPRQTTIVRKRKTSHSVAIVAGSAGVGAAIGALAGGGKGAAIGALAGGGGGLVYDRLTHKKTVRQ